MSFGFWPWAARRSSWSSSRSIDIPCAVERDVDDPGLVGGQRRDRAGVRRALGDHDVAGIDERPQRERDRLLAARGDQDAVGLGDHPVLGHQPADRLAQLEQALGRPVLQRGGPVVAGDRVPDLVIDVGREGVGVREAARQGDDLRPLGERHEIAHRRRLDPHRARGEAILEARRVPRDGAIGRDSSLDVVHRDPISVVQPYAEQGWSARRPGRVPAVSA